MKPRIYFENLDALRAIAAFTVVIYHISYYLNFPGTEFFYNLKTILTFHQMGGQLGVYFFFILSGFLVTYLIISEKESTGKVDVLFFYIKRILRIFPLYFLSLFAGFIIYPLIINILGGNFHEAANWKLYVSFLTNFDHIFNTFPSTGILGVQWSVAIEEQFYLLWPIVFIFFYKKNYFPLVLISMIIFSHIFYLTRIQVREQYFHSFSSLKFLSTGALIAYIYYHHINLFETVFNKLKRPFIFLIYCICLFLLFFQYEITLAYPWYKYFHHILPLLFFSFVIVEQIHSKNSFVKFGKSTILNWLGQISYGIYLIHMISIYLITGLFSGSNKLIWLQMALVIAGTIIISHLSFKYYESYFLSLKAKYSNLKIIIKGIK